MEEAKRRVHDFVEHYNNVRLNSWIGYITPADKLADLERVIAAERDRKLEEARKRRELARQPFQLAVALWIVGTRANMTQAEDSGDR